MKSLISIAMLLLFAVPLYAAEEVYLKDLGNGNFAVSVRETAPRIAQSSYVTVTLPPTATPAPTKDTEVLPGLAKVEVDIWGGWAWGEKESNGKYAGGRATYRPHLTLLDNGALNKFGPYIGINYWQGEKNTWHGNNTRASLGVSDTLAMELWSMTAHIGVGYQESQGRDRLFRSHQENVMLEGRAELNIKNRHANWLKRQTVYMQVDVPLQTTQHNTWNGQRRPSNAFDYKKVGGGVLFDVLTSNPSKNGYKVAVGVSGQVVHLYGNNDTSTAVGPYLRLMNKADLVRVGVSRENHSRSESATRVDVSFSVSEIIKILAK